MREPEVIWHGTPGELGELAQAVQRYCQCDFNSDGLRTTCCKAHEAMLDQKFLDRMLFGRRLQLRLKCEEFGTGVVAARGLA